MLHVYVSQIDARWMIHGVEEVSTEVMEIPSALESQPYQPPTPTRILVLNHNIINHQKKKMNQAVQTLNFNQSLQTSQQQFQPHPAKKLSNKWFSHSKIKKE